MTEQIESGYYLDVYTKRIREACDNIRNEYVYIGFQLNELNGSELFQHEAITIAEYAEMEFGFKKSLTYSMMKVADVLQQRKVRILALIAVIKVIPLVSLLSFFLFLMSRLLITILN